MIAHFILRNGISLGLMATMYMWTILISRLDTFVGNLSDMWIFIVVFIVIFIVIFIDGWCSFIS